MPIDKASIFAERFKANPNILRAAVLGQSVSPELDAYTALRALQLVNENARMQQAMQARGAAQSPSLVDEAVAPQQMGLGALAGGAPGMGPNMAAQGAPAPQDTQAPQPSQPPQAAASGGLAGFSLNDKEYAQGGIVAFSGKDEDQVVGANEMDLGYEDDDDDDDELSMVTEGGGEAPVGVSEEATPGGAKTPTLAQRLNAINNAIAESKYVPRTQEEVRAAAADRTKEWLKEYGPSDSNKYSQYLEEAIANRGKDLETKKGLALLNAAAAMSSRRMPAIQALTQGAATFGGAYGKAMDESNREQRALIGEQVRVADMYRKEKYALFREAMAAERAGDSARAAAIKNQIHQLEATGKVLAAQARAAAAQRGAAPKPENWNLQLVRDIRAGLREEHPDWSEAQIAKEAAERYRTQGPLTTATATANVKALEAWEKLKTIRPSEYRKRVEEAGGEEAARANFIKNYVPPKVPVETPSSVNKKSSTTPAKVPKMGDVQDGYRFKGGDPAQAGNWEKV